MTCSKLPWISLHAVSSVRLNITDKPTIFKQNTSVVTMQEDDNAWVFDSLICFLNGPIWNAPLQSFIEEKSLIFEPNVTENNEYQKIYDEFKNLVDFMLGNFMEDIGITPEQFEEACRQGQNYHINFDHNLFEQIWAANDYEMFKRMMTQKNVELQLQALELIEQKYGITPQSFIPKKEEENNVREIPVTIETNMEKEILNEIARNFPKEEPSSSQEDVKYIMEEKEILEKTLKEAKEHIVVQLEQAGIDKNKMKISNVKKDAEESNVKYDSKKAIKRDDSIENPTEAEITFDKKPVQKDIDSVELKKRQEYLKAQRDKLVALKKEARKKHLDAENGSNDSSRVRPKSAKAAEAVLTGEQATIHPQQLQIRKALAERLKSEVVTKK